MASGSRRLKFCLRTEFQATISLNISLMKHSQRVKILLLILSQWFEVRDWCKPVASIESLWSSMKGRTGDVLASVGLRAWKAAISLGKLSNEH